MKKLILAVLLAIAAAPARAFVAYGTPGERAAALVAARLPGRDAGILLAQAPDEASPAPALPADLQSAPDPAPTPIMQDLQNALGYVPATWTSLQLTPNLSIGISKDVGDFYTVGARDYVNGQWLSGWGKELFPIVYKGQEVAYIAAQNLFNASEAGKGAVGAAIGIRPVNLINGLAQGLGAASQLINLPPVAQQVGNFLSFEAGYDYRIQNTPGVSRHVGTVGGQVRIPFDLLKGL